MQIVDKIFLVLSLISFEAFAQSSQMTSVQKTPQGVQMSFKDGTLEKLPTVQASAGNLRATVSSRDNNAVRIEFFNSDNATCSSSPCPFENKTSGITSMTRGAVGVYTVNFAADTWSSSPACSVTAQARTNNHNLCVISGSCSTTSCSIGCYLGATGAAVEDNPVILCMGFK